MYLVLVTSFKKVFVVWLPRHDVRKSGTKLGIPFIAGNLSSFKAKTSIDAETLIIDVPAWM